MKNLEACLEKIQQLTKLIEHNKLLHQQTLKRTCDYYENILALMPGHVYWLNRDNVYLGCNDIQAKHVGLESRKDIIGKKTCDMLSTEEAMDIDRINTEVMEAGKPLTTIENANMEQKGAGVYFSQKVPLRDENDEVIGLLGISIDITELKKAEANLVLAKESAEAANKAKTQFIANMSHDIRTPLSGVVGLSKLLEDNLVDEESKQYARWIHESGQQLLSLLNGVMDMVSSEPMSEYTLREESFDLRQCIQDIVMLELPTIQLKGLSLRVVIDETIPTWIVTDRTKLHRVLLNLLGNAIKFTSTGYIAIEVTMLDSQPDAVRLEFRVIDTGIGITEELKNKVFERFFRADPSYHGVYAGHGIGLHVAQSYVDFLGGTIKLTSELGVGSTFSFDLVFKLGEPVVQRNALSTDYVHEPEKRDYQSPLTTESEPEASNFHILLVEDNPIALHMIQLLVHRVGCLVKSVSTASEALEAVQTTDFDLILTDIGLPDFSGDELTRKIRAWEAERDKQAIPIIGLTAHALVFTKKESIEAGMSDVFCKPIDFKTVRQIINTFLLQKDALDMSTLASQEENEAEMFAEFSAIAKTHTGLCEIDRFNLDDCPLLDTNQAAEDIKNTPVLNEILSLMLTQEIPNIKQSLQAAHTVQNWDAISKLAHKMKSGALYSGLVKMMYACEQLVECYKANHQSVFDTRYYQLIKVLDETSQMLSQR